MLVELLRATSREDEAREQLEKMAEDLEAMGDKAGARKARERLQAVEAEHNPPPAPSPVPPSGPRRGDLIFLDTGVDAALPGPQSSPHRSTTDSPRLAKEPPVPVKAPAPPPSSQPAVIEETQVPEGLILNEDLGLTADSIDDLIIEPVVHEEEAAGPSDSLLGIERIGESMFEMEIDLDTPLDIQREEPPDLGFGGCRWRGWRRPRWMPSLRIRKPVGWISRMTSSCPCQIRRPCSSPPSRKKSSIMTSGWTPRRLPMQWLLDEGLPRTSWLTWRIGYSMTRRIRTFIWRWRKGCSPWARPPE